jgi:hypothetical protein
MFTFINSVKVILFVQSLKSSKNETRQISGA